MNAGRVTKGIEIKEGRVYRPQNTNSEFVHSALNFLKRAGCDFVPDILGIDSNGREILSYIEGEVPGNLGYYDDHILRIAARLILSFHRYGNGEKQLIHNDLSPCNMVFRDGVPVGIIDFDACSYGNIYQDVGYAVWLWLDIGNADYSGDEQLSRIKVFADSYGDLNYTCVVESILLAQKKIIESPLDDENKKWAENCLAWSKVNLK